ncbi:FAR1 DNA-binding domain [Sesbania bispinosa]|nr:FAR1 DNA-binding domain [Sesbania bispinosa]
MDVENTESSIAKGTEDHERIDHVSDEATIDEQPNLCPSIGMEFDSLEDVKELYTSFAKKTGFGIRTRSTKENFCILVCSNEGKHIVKNGGEEECTVCMGKTKKKCSTSRTDCKASLVVSKAWKRSKWIIKSFDNAHNHAMISPKSVSYLRCHKKMSKAAKNLVEKFDEEGVPTGKFDKAMDSRYEKERREDFESRHRSRLLDIKSKIGEHAASIYTRAIFGKFHDELAKINQFTKEKIEKNGSQYTYRVSNCFESRDTVTVCVDLDTKRWTKDANRVIGFNENGATSSCDANNSVTLRSIHVHSQASLLSDLAAKSENLYMFISSEMEQTYKRAIAMESEMCLENEVFPQEASCQNLLCEQVCFVEILLL